MHQAVSGFSKLVIEACSIKYETTIFDAELEIERQSLEWVDLLLPVWSALYPVINDDLLKATRAALMFSWGGGALVCVDVPNANLVLRHPSGLEVRKFIAF